VDAEQFGCPVQKKLAEFIRDTVSKPEDFDAGH
jgi:hypothetical protein